MNAIEVIINFFKSDFSGLFTYIKILGALISIVFLGGIIAASIGTSSVSARRKEKRIQHFVIEKQAVSAHMKQWEHVSSLFKSPDPTAWRMAIIDADTMLEDMISDMGYQGDTFGEKLMAIQRDGISWTDAAWDVHLLRNKLAHEGSRYPLSDREAFRAYKIYENILTHTGYLAK